VKVPVWHPAVETYDVLEKGAVIGRIYLDMFPRKDKYQHFRSGSAGELGWGTAASGSQPDLQYAHFRAQTDPH